MFQKQFQFLMVQLKEGFPDRPHLQKTSFQFLMVQLKVRNGEFAEQHRRISIPYGSIKSPSAMRSAISNSQISIPYGSIKSSA